MSRPAKIAAVLLNLILIAVIESTGQYFYNSGWIHWIYVVFILASVYLIFSRYKLYDPVLSRMLNFSVVALLIFAVSHTFKFVELSAAAEINLHLTGLVALLFGAELVLKSYARRSAMRLWIWGIVAAIFLLTPVFFIWKNIALEFYGWTLVSYVAVIAAVECLLLIALRQVSKAFSLLRNFSKHIAWASLFITLAVIIIVLGDVLQDYAGMPAYQVEYVSYFSLYIALTFIFTAFLRLSELGGMYALKEDSAKNITGVPR